MIVDLLGSFAGPKGAHVASADGGEPRARQECHHYAGDRGHEPHGQRARFG